MKRLLGVAAAAAIALATGAANAESIKIGYSIAKTGLFAQGAVVATLNPKTALFFLAFLPQFVSPAQGAVWLQVLLLGVAEGSLRQILQEHRREAVKASDLLDLEKPGLGHLPLFGIDADRPQPGPLPYRSENAQALAGDGG